MIPTRLKLAVAEVVLGAATLCGLPPVIASPVKAVTQTMTICWYGKEFHGKMMANGQLFDEDKLTAAHKPYLWAQSYCSRQGVASPSS